MSNLIVITPEAVRRMSADFEKHRAEAEEQIRTMQQRIDTLQWSGVTQESFVQRFETAKKHMQEYIDLMMRIIEILKVIAQRFEETDNAGRRG